MSSSDFGRRTPGAGSDRRKFRNRAALTDRVAKLLGEQPWPGYDEDGVDAISTKLDEADSETARRVERYERSHKNRPRVLEAASRRIGR